MSGVPARVEALAGRLARALEQHRLLFLAAYSLAYFAFVGWVASRKPFWFDELFTHYLARVPKTGDLLEALRAGIDHHPPAFFLLTRGAYALLGETTLAARLPEALGFWIMTLCVFGFVARRTCALYGAAAMISPLPTFAFRFAFDARPYGLVLGFAALAALAWQSAAEGRRRGLALAGLALATAGASSTSYYGVLLFAPLAAAEVVRGISRRRIDAGVAGALAVGATAAALHLPLVLRSVSGFEERNWASPYARVSYDIYATMFGDLGVVAAMLVVLVAVWYALGGGAAGETAGALPLPRRQGDPPAAAVVHGEVALGIGLLLLPLLGHVLAVALTNKITARYVVAAVVGFAILFGPAAYRATRGSAAFAAAFLASALAVFVVGQMSLARHAVARARAGSSELATLLAGQPATLPVALDDPHVALERMHHEPPEIASRLYFLVDPEAQRRHGSVPYSGRTWLRMRPWIPAQAATLADFRRRHGAFLLYSTGSPFEYLVNQLAADGADLRVVAVSGPDRLLLVRERPGVRPSTPSTR